ncbi:MAG: redoxin domain-containing protein [Planctomycetes bacterium]|nr:redoxin domain-containing protein [Planctomycetota bacterium]
MRRMIRRGASILVLTLVLAAPVPAQDAPPPSEPPATPPAAGDDADGKIFDALFQKLSTAEPNSQEEADKLLDGAIADFEGYLKEHPKSPKVPDALFLLGQVYLRARRSADALTRFQQFTKDHPTHPDIEAGRTYCGIILTGLRQYDAAIATLSDLAEHSTDETIRESARLFLAQAYKESGKTEEAMKAYEALTRAADERIAAQAKSELADLAVLGHPPKPFLVGEGETRAAPKDIDGKEFSLAAYKGKVILIDFWATWCPPCRAELPTVKRIFEKYRDRNFIILGISLDEDRETLSKFLATEGMTWPQYFDGKGWDNALARLFEVESIPRTFLLDAEGNVRHVNVRGDALAAAVDALMAPPPAADPPAPPADGPK